VFDEQGFDLTHAGDSQEAADVIQPSLSREFAMAAAVGLRDGFTAAELRRLNYRRAPSAN
jgi:hypothetical protein